MTLRITAQWADEWNVWGNVEVLKHKMSVLDSHCADLGRDPRKIQRSAAAMLFHVDDPDTAEKLRGSGGAKNMMVGNTEELREILTGYRDAGVDELIIPDLQPRADGREVATLDRFMKDVVPVIR